MKDLKRIGTNQRVATSQLGGTHIHAMYAGGQFGTSVAMLGGQDCQDHNFVVTAPMTMRFGTGMKFDIFCTVVSKKFVTSLLLRNYDVLTCILADAWLIF